MLKDPWVISYERLHEILFRAGVSGDLTIKQKRKMLLNHRESVTIEEFQEAIKLLKHLYPEESW